MTIIKTKLLAHLRQDIEFNIFDDTVLKQVVENLEIENYLLEKRYLDYSYVVIDNLIINLDDIYFLCKDFSS